MSIKIVNKTKLNYTTIGTVIDQIMMGDDDTHYEGQIEWTVLEIYGKPYICQIRYLKKYVEWLFSEKNKL